MSAQRRIRRRLARQDGRTVDGVCPRCSATLEVTAPSGWRVVHDPWCEVLAGDPAARIIADVRALHEVLGIDRVAVVLPQRGAS